MKAKFVIATSIAVATFSFGIVSQANAYFIPGNDGGSYTQINETPVNVEVTPEPTPSTPVPLPTPVTRITDSDGSVIRLPDTGGPIPGNEGAGGGSGGGYESGGRKTNPCLQNPHICQPPR